MTQTSASCPMAHCLLKPTLVVKDMREASTGRTILGQQNGAVNMHNNGGSTQASDNLSEHPGGLWISYNEASAGTYQEGERRKMRRDALGRGATEGMSAQRLIVCFVVAIRINFKRTRPRRPV